jgi:5-formyltetrahydrofolate cyclo-ligase
LNPKADLRRAALSRRDAMGAEARARASAAIAARAAPLLDVPHGTVSAYWPIRGEADPLPLVDLARRRGLRIALPALHDGSALRFHLWEAGEALVPAGFGTLGPPPTAPEAVPDIVLLPLAAFDRKLHRIGYGKGHYDRAVAALRAAGRRPLLVGLAFAAQEVDNVPFEPHDVPLDFVVTERERIAAPARGEP